MLCVWFPCRAFVDLFVTQACGDVITKKSVDKHRNQCRGASFSCLDCNVHFNGTDYRAHTSCISEAQKYQGHLYKEKEKKSRAEKRKSMGGNEHSHAMVPRRAYVEDAPEGDDSQTIAVIDVPPRAPTPPPVPQAAGELPDSINVFDFLVTEDTPNSSKTAIQAANGRRVVEHTPYYANGDSQYSRPPPHHHNNRHSEYLQYGFSYGESPIPPSFDRYDSWQNLQGVQNARTLAPPPTFVTPMPKEARKEKKSKDKHVSISESTEKKRKRHQVEDLDLTSTRRSTSRDEPTSEAVPNTRVLSSGLTGGLSKLVTDSDFYDDRISAGPTPISPAKRSRREEDKKERRKSSYTSYSTTTSKSPSTKYPDDKYNHRSRSAERKYNDEKYHHRARSLDRSEPVYHDDRHRHRKHHQDSFSSEDKPPNRKRHVRAIEYPPDRIERPASVQPTSMNQMVTYGQPYSRADLFMSLVNKGPGSERGCSMNKVLKRYHRERDARGEGEKEEEDKELWKAVRLRKNERGEIVLFV